VQFAPTVPAIRDRVAETAAVLVLEPIFEADLPPEQYAYRQDRSALDAVAHEKRLLNTGHGQIVDADLSGYLDRVPQCPLIHEIGPVDHARL
jgi:retron-type reverse transcriptase